MSSRDKILATVKSNQPAYRALPPLPGDADAATPSASADLIHQFITLLEAIGGSAYLVSGFDRIGSILREQFPKEQNLRIVSGCAQLSGWTETPAGGDDPHTLANIELAILPAHFGVAENGACWITEDRMIHRALPFITQHLALVIEAKNIVANMHEAYERIAELESGAAGSGSVESDAVGSGSVESGAVVSGAVGSGASTYSPGYGFGTFIAGPSKTADIEQSLVLGAHGPRSLIVFLLDESISDAGFY
jgi:L-lactate dehydrogenase complex protein LldG